MVLFAILKHMKILKSEIFRDHEKLCSFVNNNKIQNEDILIITGGGAHACTLFFYGDDDIEQKKDSFWD